MYIKHLYEIKEPVISFEVFPPKQESPIDTITDALSEIAQLKPGFISVTYGAGGNEGSSKTTEIASFIKNTLLTEPLPHLIAAGAKKSDIKATLNELKENNIENIMVIRGDLYSNSSKNPVGDFQHASDLIQFIKENGKFSVGAACYPEGQIDCDNSLSNYDYLYDKQLAGADFLISQLFFENGRFFRFLEQAQSRGVKIPVAAGLMPILGKSQIQRMIFQCGVSLPASIIRILHKYENSPEDLQKAGIEYTCNQIEDLIKNGHKNIHVYSMNKPEIAIACKNKFDSLI
ncbi:MAG: methylenetetrahydrofolate reductase [Proteocatella sp.]